MRTTPALLGAHDLEALAEGKRQVAGSPRLAGVASGLSAGLLSAIAGECPPAPAVVGIPAALAGGSGPTWSADARAYAEGFDIGWTAVHCRANPSTGWCHDGNVVVDFVHVLSTGDLIDDTADSMLYAIEKPWKWAWEYGVWSALNRPQKGDPGWMMFVAVIEALRRGSDDGGDC